MFLSDLRYTCNTIIQMDKFDLNIHEIDDVVGKVIDINNSSYLIDSFVAEGGEKWVYSTKNVESNIDWFVLKIHKFKPDPERIAKELNRLNGFSLMLGGKKNFLIGECYHIGGALVELEPNFAMKDPYGQLINDAVKGTKETAERFEVYDKILSENPAHDYALAIKSNEYFNLGKFREAYISINDAIKIEPNKRDYFLLRFQILANYGMVDRAISSLFDSIDLYPYSGKIWEAAMKAACDFDRIKTVKELLSIAETAEVTEPFINPYLKLYESSKKRYMDYFDLLESYSKETIAERKGEILEAAISGSKNNEYAHLMLSALLFEKGDFHKAIENAEWCLFSSNTLVVLAAQLISAFCFFSLNEYQSSQNYFVEINQTVDNVFDLPKIPVSIIPKSELEENGEETMFVEELSCNNIIEILDKLVNVLGSESDPELIELENKYKQLELEMNGK